MDKHHDKEGRELRYNDTAETASREMAERVRRGEEHVVPDLGEGGADAAAGALGGAAAGGTAGMLVLGPIGAAIAAIAGALGGWWSTSATTTAAEHFTPEEDRYYREQYEAAPNHAADLAYERVRPAYQLGHVAAHNPAYQGKHFEEIEPEITQAWSDEMRARYGDWAGMRGYVRDAYARRSMASTDEGLQDRSPESEADYARDDAERHHG